MGGLGWPNSDVSDSDSDDGWLGEVKYRRKLKKDITDEFKFKYLNQCCFF